MRTLVARNRPMPVRHFRQEADLCLFALWKILRVAVPGMRGVLPGIVREGSGIDKESLWIRLAAVRSASSAALPRRLEYGPVRLPRQMSGIADRPNEAQPKAV